MKQMNNEHREVEANFSLPYVSVRHWAQMRLHYAVSLRVHQYLYAN